VEVVAPNCEVAYIGIRPGEKVHEVLVSEDEARNTLEFDEMYVIQPVHPWWSTDQWTDGQVLSDGFRYSSDTNPLRLSKDKLAWLLKDQV
jgi:UDP-N-acetylglucosamine 4,6-dehydratase